jgi:DNA-directed RNA polymerase subunit M/transcription elongation factor TFIIS
MSRGAGEPARITINEPVAIPPPAAVARGIVGDVIAALMQCPQGQWLPVEVEKTSQASALVSGLRKHNYETRRVGLMVYVHQHAHHWLIENDGRSKCKTCGSFKEADAAERRQMNAPRRAENTVALPQARSAAEGPKARGGDQECPQCHAHPRSAAHMRTCLTAREGAAAR